MCIQLIPVMNIGDIIILISTITYIYFTYRAQAQMKKNIDIQRMKELLKIVIIPIIANLKRKIELIDSGLSYYDKSCGLIENRYRFRLIFIELERRHQNILKDIKKLDFYSSMIKENYDELCRVIVEEIKDESIKRIKEYNEKPEIEISRVRVYVDYSEEQIIHDIETLFVRYVMGLNVHSSMVEYFWDEYGSHIMKCADTKVIRELKVSIEKDVDEMRKLIINLKSKLEKKRDSIMREYGIPEEMVEITISRL